MINDKATAFFMNNYSNKLESVLPLGLFKWLPKNNLLITSYKSLGVNILSPETNNFVILSEKTGNYIRFERIGNHFRGSTENIISNIFRPSENQPLKPTILVDIEVRIFFSALNEIGEDV